MPEVLAVYRAEVACGILWVPGDRPYFKIRRYAYG